MRKNIILMLALLVSGAACAGNDIDATASAKSENDIAVAATAGVKPITGEEFDKMFMYEGVVRERPAVIDFNATWCGPCRQLAPILESLAEKYNGQVDFYSIDIDENPELAAEMGIRSIPYLVFAPSEGAPQTLTGLHDEVMLTGIIDQFLLGRVNTDVDIKYRDDEDGDDEATRALKAKREEQQRKELEDQAKKNAGKKGKK